MTTKTIDKYVKVRVRLPTKLIERLEKRFNKDKNLINKFVVDAVKEDLARRKRSI